MNSYIDYTILGNLKITPSEIDEFPMELFSSLFNKTTLMEVDPFSVTPLRIRKSNIHHLENGELKNDEEILKELYFVTIVMIRQLQEEKIQGKVILYYKFNIQHWDVEIVCSAFPLVEVEVANG